MRRSAGDWRVRMDGATPITLTMTAKLFRRIALRMPEATEGAHMAHPDFRVRNKIFATLGPGEAWGMVKLTPEQQRKFVQAEPDVFVPVRGAWGRQGATTVVLAQRPRNQPFAAPCCWLGAAVLRSSFWCGS